eukprot:TRINITY_DN4002_c0_g1_i4.p1 TRINITY_DN4002_c0_g1~~TRINITY_DN4002_c0_g1_i4.p1  ORF type:complete len:147 (+),score=7.42 TRINITY_DN4002_c0_g1_i4:305-745(+)
MAYQSFVPQNQDTLINGLTPDKVHIHIRRILADQIPEGHHPEKLAAWTNERFAMKEKQLVQFYENQSGTLGGEPVMKQPPHRTMVVGCMFWIGVGYFEYLLWSAPYWVGIMLMMGGTLQLLWSVYIRGGADVHTLQLHEASKAKLS